MATEDNIIVAVELGSSKIQGAAGKRLADGTIQVLAYTQEEASSFIQRGVVYNIDKTTQSLNSILRKLEGLLGKKISHLYVGFGGQGLHTVHNVVTRELEPGTAVTQELVEEINAENGNMKLSERRSFNVVPQEYVVGTSQKTMDPVGILTGRIQGHFLNLATRTTALVNMQNCFKNTGIKVFNYICAPQVLADSVLTDVDKRSGCALVDLGKDTTTVSVFKNNLLRYISVIPLGVGNVTKDLAGSLQIDESEAEELKLKYGSAYTEMTEADESTAYKLSDGRSVSKQEFCDIVEARIEEILVNVKIQIERSTYTKDTLLDGLVLTGGGACMKDMEKAVTTYTGFDKLRVARMVNFPVTSSNHAVNEKDGRKNVILGLLAIGSENCCGAEKQQEDLFGAQEKPTKEVPATPSQEPGSTTVDQIAAEEKEKQDKQKAIDAIKKAQEEADARAKAERDRRQKEKEARKAAQREKRRTMVKNVTNWLGRLVSPDPKDDERD